MLQRIKDERSAVKKTEAYQRKSLKIEHFLKRKLIDKRSERKINNK